MESLSYYKRRLAERRNRLVLRGLGAINDQKVRATKRRRKLDTLIEQARELVFSPEPVVLRGPSPAHPERPVAMRLRSSRWRVREEAAKQAAGLSSLDDTTRARLVELLADEQLLVARAAFASLMAHRAVDLEAEPAAKALLSGPDKEIFSSLIPV